MIIDVLVVDVLVCLLVLFGNRESENQNLRSMQATMQENLASAREEVQEKMRLYLDVIGQKKIADQNLTKINAKYDQCVLSTEYSSGYHGLAFKF